MLTEKEFKVLRCLRKNSRKSMTKISRETKIPIASVMLIIKRLEKAVITKYTSLLNYSSLGYNIKVHFFVKNIEEKMLSHPQINTIYKLSGKYNYFIEGVFKNISDVEKFKEKLGEHKQFFVTDETKVEVFQP